MFAYDNALADAAQTPAATIDDVLRILQTVQNTCIDGDGLKWFNWLYLEVTQAVANRVSGAGFADPKWLATLDVQFANLYFRAIRQAITGGTCAGCWKALFARRDEAPIARIQFALAGMNAHINHDLAFAIVAACRETKTAPQHGTSNYSDYTAINSTLDSLIDTAKKTLRVRLLGALLPEVSHLEDLIAAWNVADFRERAWNNAESLWQDSALVAAVLEDAIDGITTFAGNALLVPVPA